METATLLLHLSGGSLLIDTDTLVRVEASSNYCKLIFSDGKTLVTAKLLKWFEEKLPQPAFVRMHRSHLVNNKFLLPNQYVEKGFILRNGDFIRLSRRRRKNILHQIHAA
ncbi:MAG TPA: LytTR family DNA-binding domain-containing protein [Chitinophagaceae bacterium]|nr:LytTR family DNA-binding domain-containing protein [Chitinophagaceae bacterium]